MFRQCLILAGDPSQALLLLFGGALVLLGLFVAFLVLKFGSLYLQALLSGAPVSFMSLIGMSLRKVSASVIVQCRIMAKKAGMNVETDRLEAHYLARGNVPRVIQALIAANKANIDLTFDRACAVDLAGRDILEAIRTTVNPRVIDCPIAGGPRPTVDGVAKNGIQLKVKARVTVRTNIDRLVKGATEETIIARVGEGIVAAIGSADDHKSVLEHPDQISKTVLAKGLDVGTAFEILSIDIADVDVGENIGAKLQGEQAEADKRVAQANAEKRRAMAVALEQEMLAKTQENRALVVEAEAEVPKALAHALREGKLGVMDLYNLRNIQADTAMRSAIAGGPAKEGTTTLAPGQ